MYCTSCGNALQANDNFCTRCGARAAAGPMAQNQPAASVFINGRELAPEQIRGLQSTYRSVPLPGRYWYDSLSGAWGFEGREAAGFIFPGHDFGPLAREASRGNTGVFINGREINAIEALRIQQTFGAVYPGKWWLDGRTGNFGIEGNPFPLGNVTAALQAQHSGNSGDNFWSSATAAGNDNGSSGYVNVGGGTIVGYDR